MNVELYSKPDCHLCEEAKAVLLEVQKEIPFELREVDVSRDPVLFERFKTDIPVVFINGKQWFRHRIPRDTFRERLERDRAFAMGSLDPQKTLWRAKPVSRTTKVIFAIAAIASFAALVGAKVYTKFFLDEERALAGLELIPQDRAAPDFQLSAPGDGSVNLSGFKGQLLLVNFYATWCAPCREELPSMNMLAQTLKGERFTLLAVDVQEDWATVDKFFGAQRPTFALALDASGKAAEAYEQRARLMFPETFVVKDGRVLAKFEGPRDWTDPTMLRYLRKLIRG